MTSEQRDEFVAEHLEPKPTLPPNHILMDDSEVSPLGLWKWESNYSEGRSASVSGGFWRPVSRLSWEVAGRCLEAMVREETMLSLTDHGIDEFSVLIEDGDSEASYQQIAFAPSLPEAITDAFIRSRGGVL